MAQMPLLTYFFVGLGWPGVWRGVRRFHKNIYQVYVFEPYTILMFSNPTQYFYVFQPYTMWYMFQRKHPIHMLFR